MAKPDYISGIKFYPTTGGKGPVGKGSITFADAFFVEFVIWEYDGKPRVDFPNEVNPKFDPNQPVSKDNKKYFNKAGPTSPEAAAELVAFILAELERGGSSSSGSASGKSPARSKLFNDDPIPF